MRNKDVFVFPSPRFFLLPPFHSSFQTKYFPDRFNCPVVLEYLLRGIPFSDLLYMKNIFVLVLFCALLKLRPWSSRPKIMFYWKINDNIFTVAGILSASSLNIESCPLQAHCSAQAPGTRKKQISTVTNKTINVCLSEMKTLYMSALATP